MGVAGVDRLMASAAVAHESLDADPVYFHLPGVALVTWNPDLKAACVESQGWATSSELEVVFSAVIKALRAHRGSRCLVYGRRIRVINQAEHPFITETWLARAQGAGLRLTALVKPVSRLATMRVDDLARQSHAAIDFRYFPTVEQAVEWLTSSGTAA
jgi:hypothetical protein